MSGLDLVSSSPSLVTILTELFGLPSFAVMGDENFLTCTALFAHASVLKHSFKIGTNNES
jgi:hypothetical protein